MEVAAVWRPRMPPVISFRIRGWGKWPVVLEGVVVLG